MNKKINNLKVKYKKDKKKFLLLLSSLFLAISLLCGSSYAYLTYISKTDNKTLIEAGTLALTLKNESNEIIFEGAVPQDDNDALKNNKEYEFTLENKGSLDSMYKIKLNNMCTLDQTFNINGEDITPDKCIPNEYIKVGLKKTDNTYKEGVLKGNPDINGAVLSSNGMEFDGNDYIDMGNANYDFGTSITVAARVKFNETSTQQYSIINNAEVAGFAFQKNKNNNLEFLAYSSAESAYKYAISTTTVETNKWYTVVGTYNGENIRIYVNGVKEAETVFAGKTVSSTMPIFIGANPQPNGEHLYILDGTISDVLVTNDVLTEEEIAENYSNEFNYYDNDKTLFYQNWNEKVYSDYEVLEYDEEDGSYILDQNILKSNEEISYKMKLWLSYDTPNDYNSQNMYNIIYSGALAVEYEQGESENIKIEVEYDTSTYSGPSSKYTTSVYQTLSKSKLLLKPGESDTVIVSPAYPDDRYTGSVSCTNGIAATLTEGSGTTSREDIVEIRNDTDSNVGSVCTIIYTPKWEGIPEGTYKNGITTIGYGNSMWTVKSDNGDSVGLALNGNAGTGVYKTDVQEELNNTVVNSDIENGAILEQTSGAYVSTDSGLSKNYASVGQVYWSGSETVTTNETINEYTLGSAYEYLSGYRTYNTSTSSNGSTTNWNSSTFSASYSSSILYSAGASVSAANTDSTITFSNAALSSASQGYMSSRYMVFQFRDYNDTASASKCIVRRWTYDNIADSYILEPDYITNTKTWKLYFCGSEYHGKYYTITGVDNTYYKYTSPSGATSKINYGSLWQWFFASNATSTTSGTANSSLVRTYRFDESEYCVDTIKYTVSNLTKDIYYRPYLIVRER